MKTKWIITVRHAAESYGLQFLDTSKIVKNDMGMRRKNTIRHNMHQELK